MQKTHRPNAGRWYERESWPYAADRQTAEQYADWIKLIPWKLFCTFTFAWRVSDPQATKTFNEFINRLERDLKCDVGYVRGDEKRFSGCGKPASGRHFHVLLTSAAPMNPWLVEGLWMSMAGTRADLGSAHVLPYDADLDGVSYVLKSINRADGDWAFKKLHLFASSMIPEMVTRRMRRHLRRHHERTHLLATARLAGDGLLMIPYVFPIDCPTSGQLEPEL
jgi:hypothetical protein